MVTSVLRIAVSGLNAAQAGLATTGHNIANVNTPGYSRQEAIQQNNPGQFTGSGYFGRGVSVSTVLRRYDGLMANQVRAAEAGQAHFETAATQASTIDNLLGDPTMGLTPALSDFFDGLSSVTAAPGDSTARSSFIAEARALAARFRTIGDSIQTQQQALDNRLSNAVNSANSLARQIGDINAKISAASGSDHAPNDLLDQRDALVGQLAKVVGVNFITQSDGSANVFLANGQPIVMGDKAYTLVAAPDRFDPQRKVVGLDIGNGNFTEFTPENLSGGEIGGLLAARRDTLDPAQNALGRLAMVLGDQFNTQHRLGQDRNGNAGTDLFSVANPWVAGSTANLGSAQMSATMASSGALTTSDYDISFQSATGWTVKRLSDNTTQTFAALPATVDGVTINVTGTPADGDNFKLRPGRNGSLGIDLLISDPSLIAAAAPVRTAGSGNSGTGGISLGAVQSVGANLQQPVTITFNPNGTFNVSGTGTGNPTNVAYTPGMTISYNGWSATLNGTPAAGDTFTVSANTGGVGDNRNALALAALQTARVVGNGSASIGEGYASLVAAVGSSTHEAQVSGQAQAQMALDANNSLQSVSGVNLDEEAANLMKYQQAYQAAGKVVQVAGQMFDALISVVDR